jgi:8-oxo-dGTP pyrophosphatase MutT (NUDIX family)
MGQRLVGGLTSRDLDESSASGRLAFVQKAFVASEGKLLLVQKAPSDPYYPGLWEVPGGRMKLGEDQDAHIRRETWEETGINVTPGAPFHLWQWFMPDPGSVHKRAWVQAVAVARVCDPLSLEPTTAHQVPGDHICQARWVDTAKVFQLRLIPGVDEACRVFLALQREHALSPLRTL